MRSALLRAWFAHRQVVRATVAVVCGALVILGVVGWRVVADRHDPVMQHAPVSVDQLALGHRYLLGPLVGLMLVVVAVAGSVASSDALWGVSSMICGQTGGLRRGLRRQVAVAACTAAGWFVALAVALTLSAAVVLVALGDGRAASIAAATAAGQMVARLALSAAVLAAMATVIGIALPGSAMPTVVLPLAVALTEGTLLVASHGRVALAPFGVYVTLALGRAGLNPGMAPSWVGAAVPAVLWLGGPLCTWAGVEGVARFRPPPS